VQGTNHDGSVAVGFVGNAVATRAVIWLPGLGMQDLNTYLPAMGVNLAGWTLSAALSVSADGQTLVGGGLHNGVIESWVARLPVVCYANCDGSVLPPVLNVSDFLCFMNRYAAGDPYANCDGTTTPPVLNVNDFICFLTRYAQGCP